MTRRSILATLVLSAVFLGTFTSTSDACWWHHHGHHCHRCQRSSQSSTAASSASNAQPQQFISIDATSLLLKLIERGGVGAGTESSDVVKRIDALTARIDSTLEQMKANTEAIDTLKIGQEAIANRVNNEFATKTEVGTLVEAAVKIELGNIDTKISDKIDERFNTLKEELNKDLNGREIMTAMNAFGATHRLSAELKPFTTSAVANTTQHAAMWAKGKFLRVEGTAANGRLKV